MQTNRLQAFLRFLPASLFGAVMGLCGLSFAWIAAGSEHKILKPLGEFIGLFAIAVFILLTVLYLVKYIRYPEIVRLEFNNPVTVSFFGTFPISLLLIPGIVLPFSMNAAFVIWCIGTFLMLLFALFVLRFWLAKPKQLEQIHPAWIIPVVGTLDVPIIGLSFPFEATREICTFFFAAGLLFAIILLTMLFARLTIKQLTVDQQASQLILIGPLALAFNDLENLAGPGLPSSVIFYADFFLLILFASKLIKLPFCCPFRLGWWAVSFPLSAITIVSYRFSLSHQQYLFHLIFWALLTTTTVVIAFLLFQTLYRYFNQSFLEATSLTAADQPGQQTTNNKQ